MICSKIALSVKSEFVLIPPTSKKGKYFQDEFINKTTIPLKPKIFTVRHLSSIFCKINHFASQMKLFKSDVNWKFVSVFIQFWQNKLRKWGNLVRLDSGKKMRYYWDFRNCSTPRLNPNIGEESFGNRQFFQQTLSTYINIGRWTFQLTVNANLI
jgi:hypothetical protein